MSPIKDKLLSSIDLLNEDDARLAYELVQRMLIPLDADYTLVTIDEEERIQKGLQELKRGDYITLDDFIKQQNKV